MLIEDMKNMMRASILAPLCGALALLSGCTAGQTGGEVGAGGPNGTGGTEGTGGNGTVGGGTCDVTDSTLLSRDEVSSLGYSADDILAFVGGEHRVSVGWKEGSGELVTLQTTPAAGSTELTLTVGYEGGDVTLEERDVPASNGAEGGLGIGSAPCNDQLTIDVTVRIETDNGAFDDAFPATLVVGSKSYATLRVDFDPEELNGSFRTEVLAPEDAVAKQFGLDAAFAPGGFAGSVTGTISGGNEQVAYAAGAEFLRWPAGACADIRGIPIDLTEEGLGQSAWQALTYAEPLAFQWDDGSDTTLSLELTSADGVACYQYESFSGAEYVSFEVQAHAQTADARIDGTWSLPAVVSLSNGEVSLATLYQRGNYGATPAGSFEDVTGISGADLSGYEQAGFDLRLESDFSAEPTKRSGTFAILGITAANCEPDPVPDGGESPGCAGPGADELETATIGD